MNGKVKKQFFNIIDFLFIVSVICTVFSSIPKSKVPKIILPFISYDNLLSLYPITLVVIIGLAFLFCERNYKIIAFIAISCMIYVICNAIITTHGILLIIEKITESDIEIVNSSSRRIFYSFVTKLFPNYICNERLILSELLYSLYEGIINFIDIILIPIILYKLYKDRCSRLIRLFLIGMIFSIIIVIIYELIEIPFILGSINAGKILTKINPFFYEISNTHGWWPPLLWYGQLRGPFAEPSFFSYYLGFAVSVLIFYVVKKGNLISQITLLFICVCVFLTNARSGILLLLGVFFINILLLVINQKNIKKIIILCIILFLSYIISISVGKFVVNEQNQTSVNGDNYIVNTIKSVSNPTARSNVSRYSYINSTINIWRDNLILGTGRDYLGAYLSEEMMRMENISPEMENWIETQDSIGPLNNTFPNLNEYTTALASGGIVGFLLSTVLLSYICIRYLFFVIKRGFKVLDSNSILIVSMLAVVFAWGMNNYFMANYLYLISLSLGLCDLNRIKKSYNNDSRNIISEIK